MSPGYQYHSKVYECVDDQPEAVPGQDGNTNGALFYNVLATCNGIPCPPYTPERAITCVVCTK